MKKIEETQIETYFDLISRSDLMNMNTKKTTLFFPVGLEAVETGEDQLVLLLEEKDRSGRQSGAKRFIATGLIISSYKDIEGDTVPVVRLGYVTTEYAVPFSVKDHFRYLRGSKLKKKDIAKIEDLEAYLIRTDYILGTFKY